MLLLHWYCPVGIGHLIMSFSPCPMYITWMTWSDLTTLLAAYNMLFDAHYVERCSPESTPGQPCDQLHCQGTTSISWGQNQNSRRFFLNIEHIDLPWSRDRAVLHPQADFPPGRESATNDLSSGLNKLENKQANTKYDRHWKKLIMGGE